MKSREELLLLSVAHATYPSETWHIIVYVLDTVARSIALFCSEKEHEANSIGILPVTHFSSSLSVVVAIDVLDY